MENLLELLKKEPMDRYKPDQNEVEQLCREYQIGKLVSIDGELGGLFNVNLKISTISGQYVIRVHSGLSRANHIKAEEVLLKKLKRNKIPVLTPLYTESGNYFTSLHNRFVQVTPFVRGIPFQSFKEQAYNCGNVLKKFHDTLSNEKWIPTPVWSNYPSQEVLLAGINKLKIQHNELLDISLIKEVEKLYHIVINQWHEEESFARTIIHADWHPWNMLFNNDNDVKYIFDFDFLQKGERIHDLAYFLWTIRNKENNEELGKYFLQGYGSLSSIEVELLPVAIARASLFFLCTASFVENPIQELQKQISEQKPYIEWLLTEKGKSNIKNLYLS